MEKRLNQEPLTIPQKFRLTIRNAVQVHDEKRIKSILAGSGLVHADTVDVQGVIDSASPYISPALPGEAILTIGGALTEVATHACGAIAIGPFGCMPNRISEAILGEIMTAEKKLATAPTDLRLREVLKGVDDLPFPGHRERRLTFSTAGQRQARNLPSLGRSVSMGA